MSKRPPQYRLNERTLEDEPISDDEKREKKKADISQRKIYRIKNRANQIAAEPTESQSRPTFKFKAPQGSGTQAKKNEQITKPAQIFKGFDLSFGLLGNGGGLFAPKKEGGEQLLQPKLNFDGQKKTASLFGPGANLFNLDSGFMKNKSNESLFGPSKSNQSLFGPKPAAAANEEEEDSGNSEELNQELNKEQNLTTDYSKSKGKYEYKSFCDIIKQVNAKKYKKDQGSLIENVNVVFEHDPDKNLYLIVVRLQATKVIIYSGLVVIGKTVVQFMKNKTDTLEIVAFQIKKNNIERNVLKIQMENEEEAKSLKEEIQAIVNGVPK